MNIKRTSLVALCPRCKSPFHYTECKFIGGENDGGGWKVKCGECNGLFKLKIKNPKESYTNLEWQVQDRFYDWKDDDLPTATEVVEHNVQVRKVAFSVYL